MSNPLSYILLSDIEKGKDLIPLASNKLLADEIDNKDLIYKSRNLNRVGAPDERGTIEAANNAYLNEPKHFKNINAGDFDLKETGNLEALSTKENPVILQTKMMTDIIKKNVTLAPLPTNAALAKTADEQALAESARLLVAVSLPEENFDACKQAYLNENKVFRDIQKGNVHLKTTNIVDDQEKHNFDAVSEAYLHDNKVLKDIAAGKVELKKTGTIEFIDENRFVTEQKILHSIEKNPRANLTKLAAHSNLSDAIDLESELKNVNLTHVYPPEENKLALAQGYLSIPKVFKDIEAGDFELKSTSNNQILDSKPNLVVAQASLLNAITTKSSSELTPLPTNAALANLTRDEDLSIVSNSLRSVPSPVLNFNACKESYLNDDKVMRDISKKLSKLKAVGDISKKEKANYDAAVAGFHSESGFIKNIQSGAGLRNLKKIRQVTLDKQNTVVTQAKLLNEITSGTGGLTKNASMAAIAKQLTDSELSTTASSLKHVEAPVENFEAVKLGYNGVNKVFKDIEKEHKLKHRPYVRETTSLPRHNIAAKIKKGTFDLKKVPLPKENLDAVKAAYLAEME